MRQSQTHVLFLNSRSEYSGADMALQGIVKYLDPQRYRSTVVLPHDGPLVGVFQRDGAEVVFLDLCRLERLASPAELWTFFRRGIQSVIRLRQIVRERDIDVIYTNTSAVPVGALVARLCGIPNVWHIREIWTTPRWVTKPLYRYVHRMADRIVAITHAVAHACFGYEGGKVHIVPQGLDLQRFADLDARAEHMRQRLALPHSWPVVTCAARLVPWKGLACFIEAARHVRDAGVQAYFCVAGDIPRPMYQGYKQQLIKMIRDYDLEDRVLMLGWVDDVPALLRISDIFVLASIRPEPAGMVIQEAWLAEIPVVVPDEGGPVEVVESGRNGLIFRTADAVDMAEKIIQLISDPAKRKELARAGYQDTVVEYDAKRTTETIQRDILDVLVEESHRS